MAQLTATDIVTATAAALTGRTAAGDRVYPWRTAPLPGDKLPAIVVAASTDDEEPRTHFGEVYQVTTSVGLELHVRATDDATWSAELDTLVDRCKRALLFDDDWRGQFRQVAAIRRRIGTNIEGEYRAAVALLEFDCVHDVTYEPLEDVAFVDMETVHYTDEAHKPIEAEWDTEGA